MEFELLFISSTYTKSVGATRSVIRRGEPYAQPACPDESRHAAFSFHVSSLNLVMATWNMRRVEIRDSG